MISPDPATPSRRRAPDAPSRPPPATCRTHWDHCAGNPKKRTALSTQISRTTDPSHARSAGIRPASTSAPIASQSTRRKSSWRVIDRIENLDQLQQGEVLVTRSTSTAFNYVLPRVGAIVTDRGGIMSHAAIVAREYGLPAVVGCIVAGKTIANGAMVRVDADKGEVTILS